MTCDCAMFLDNAHHDWLAGIEQRGVAGAVDLLDWIADQAVSVPQPGLLDPSDLAEFVERHQWNDHAAMAALAHRAHQFAQNLRNRSTIAATSS